MASTTMQEGALSTEEKASLMLRFTLSLPVTAAIPPRDEELFRMALKLTPSFLPLSALWRGVNITVN